MNISLSWLREYMDLDLPLDVLTDRLIATGLKVEAVNTQGVAIPHVVVARIAESVPHPDADRLSVCQVEDGTGTLRQIVCGAKNYEVGDKVPLALPGAVLPGDFKIKVGKLRGVKSEGMMCSGRELGLGEDAAGLLILSSDAVVGTPIGELFPPETCIELEITPNRPDWLGHVGVARELAAFLDIPLRLPPSGSMGVPQTDIGKCRIDDEAACSFYSLRHLRGLQVGPSPDWLRRRLESIGLRSINNVVDVTNFVLHEWGQPLHAFDAAQITGELRVRGALAGEKFLALDGTEVALLPGETVIADARGPVALAGIMGGLASGVTESTTEVLLESAYFTPSGIRRTARRTGLSTDSSYRFERGVDPQGILRASDRAAALILEVAGGEAEKEVWTVGTPATLRPVVTLRHECCRVLLGLDVTDEEIIRCLNRLGLELVGQSAGESQWRPPGFRIDLEREVDLVEEVARLVGIDRIPSRVEAMVAPRSIADRHFDFSQGLREKLQARGFYEARSSTLVSPQLLASLGIEDAVFRLKNPLGEEQSILRPSLLPGLVQALQNNVRQGRTTVRLFEIGKVYAPQASEERSALGVLATGPWRSADWRTPPVADADFAWLRGVVEELLSPSTALRWEVGRHSFCVLSARIFWLDVEIGWLGLLPPSVGRSVGVSAEIVVGEIAWEAVVTTQSVVQPYRPFPKFPATSRDLALVLPLEMPYAQVEKVLHQSEEPLVVAFQPFDVFHDPAGIKLPANKKSLAVSLTFQSSEKTLEAGEIENVMERLRSILREKLGAEFRA